MSDMENAGDTNTSSGGPGLEVFPGLDVNPDQLRILGHVPVHSIAGVGPMEIWVSWGSQSATGDVQGAFHRKRCGWDEARRLRELSTEIRSGGRAQASRDGLVEIALRANVDLLSASEALAEMAAESRTQLLQRCREVLANAGGAVTLERAIQLVGSVPNDDIRAPREVPEAFLWLLGAGQGPDAGQGVLDWLLSHEERLEGLSGSIQACDQLFETLTERRSSSTLHSRQDRASSLRFRVQSVSSLPADVVLASPVDATVHGGEPLVVVAPRAVESPGAASVSRGGRGEGALWQEAVDETRSDLNALREEVRQLARQVESIGSDEGMLIAHANASGTAPKWILPAAGLLFLGALLLWLVPGDAAAPQSDATGVESTPVAEDSREAVKSPQLTESSVKLDPAPEASGAADPKPKASAGEDPVEIAVEPEEPVEDSREAPSVEPAGLEPVDEPEPEGVQEETQLRPTVDSPEVAAERYGVGIQPTHRLIERSKLHRFGEKDFVEVTDLPGGDALVDACIVSLARNEEYRRKIYKGYHPVRLSCAGEMKVICEILGCPPEQSCVTAASWVKPCRN